MSYTQQADDTNFDDEPPLLEGETPLFSFTWFFVVLLRWQEFATRSVAVFFFLTCHRGAGGECRSVSRLALLIRNRWNRWMSRLSDTDRSGWPGMLTAQDRRSVIGVGSPPGGHTVGTKWGEGWSWMNWAGGWLGCACSAPHPAPALSLIHIWRCRRSYACRSRWSPYH